jgi:replication factor A1
MDEQHQRAMDTLSHGALSAIFTNAPNRPQYPVVQCLQIKSIAGQPGAPERYRVVFSDGTNYVQTMLATTANELVTNGLLQRGSFARLKSYQANAVKGKRYVACGSLECTTLTCDPEFLLSQTSRL